MQPDNTSVTNEYHLTGLLKKTYGSRTYPVEYTYDPQGRMKTMKTWQDFAGNSGTATTTWHYDPYRGWLTNKVHADGKGPVYTYTSAGRLKSRAWARGVTTWYTNNVAGDLVTINYLDSTPDVTYTYDRRGRTATIAAGGLTTTLAYNNASQLLSETYSGGVLNGLAVTNAYDAYLRRSAVALKTQPSTLTQFGYDLAGRLQGVTNGTYRAAYTYLANAPLVSQITLRSNGVTRMTTTKSYDFLNRLTDIQSSTGGAPVALSAYAYNAANQRTAVTNADNARWVYTYDSLGQVTSGKKYWSDGTPVAGQQFEYAFDDIGNRKNTKVGGDQNGANLRPANYTNNTLNQITSRGVPGYVEVLGLALATNTVTVNGQSTYRKGEYFRKELTVNNSSVPVWQTVSVAAAGETTVAGNVFVRKTPETFGYDADGNLTNDGRWTLTWDAENRLTKAESLATNPTASKRRVVWEFDGQGRRIRQATYNGSSGSYVVTEDLKFLSDGWRHIAELNATNNALVRSYVWGLDLSGSLDGAGGVGGLLVVNSAANGAHFCAYDGNGNVTALVKAPDGKVSAHYEYGPFGEALRVTGVMGNENPFRFSTKRANGTTDLVLYEYRVHSPSLGRWPNRDPIGEWGGVNLYCFVRNHPSIAIDTNGREEIQLPNNRNDLPRSQYDELTRQCGIPQTDNRRRLLDYGCIGVCMAAQGQDANNTKWPEQFGDTKCYLEESKARKRACPDCVRKVVFSKQGRFKDGKAPTEGADGTVPNDSVSSNTDGTFNYVTIGQLRFQEWYIWADHGVFPTNPDMTVTVSKTPCNDPHYRDKIWCTTCIKKK